MSIDVYPLFSTPLYKNVLERSNDDVLNYTKNEKFIFIENLENGYMSQNKYVLESPELKSLKDEIQKNINFFAYEVLNVDKSVEFYVANSWIVKHKFEHWSQEHYHNNSLLTGIYYFDVRENSGNIRFLKNTSFTTIFPSVFGIKFSKETLLNMSGIELKPKNKDLLLFPSHLLHSVGKNENFEERHCLAFNVFIRTVLGRDEGANLLDLR
jgi:uncharacterized protein (TIGR02466 family)